jgi:hypothetical protein
MKKQLSNLPFRRVLNFKKLFLSILMPLLLSAFIFPAYAQQGTQVETISAFYEFLKSPAGVKKFPWGGTQENLNIIIKKTEKKGAEEIFIGKVENIPVSYVFFTYKNGKVDGKVIIPGKRKAYKYYSENNKVFVVAVDIRKEICVDFEKIKSAASSTITEPAPPPGSYVYNLQSLPGATAVVLLDFDGHDATGSWWGDIIAQPANFTEAEIELAWNIISEDFRPYQLNITTNEAIYQAAPANRRMRCIFTPTTDANPGSGGVAFIGSFTTGGELAPCWVFNLGNGKDAGETGSHEIGHTMHLLHDGRDFPDGTHEEYFFGHGDWAPIMGASFFPNVSHWSIGEYQYANNHEDDINIIGTLNGFKFRPDAHGNTISTAAPLAVRGDGSVVPTQNYGVITTRTDLDHFSFTTLAGNVNLIVSPAPVYPNLDLIVRIVNSSGAIVATSNPPGLAACTLNVTLAAGKYYLRVDGTGAGNPLTNGYSDYSSIGEYRVSGKVKVAPGITGPSCVTTGKPYTFTISPEFANSYGIAWWVSGDATIQQDPLDPYKAIITLTKFNPSSLSVNVGVNYNNPPWYNTYQKTVQVGNCPQASSKTDIAILDDAPVLMKVKVMDISGRELLHGETYEPQSFIKDGSLPFGVYLMQVSDKNSSYVIKVVK